MNEIQHAGSLPASFRDKLHVESQIDRDHQLKGIFLKSFLIKNFWLRENTKRSFPSGSF